MKWRTLNFPIFGTKVECKLDELNVLVWRCQHADLYLIVCRQNHAHKIFYRTISLAPRFMQTVNTNKVLLFNCQMWCSTMHVLMMVCTERISPNEKQTITKNWKRVHIMYAHAPSCLWQARHCEVYIFTPTTTYHLSKQNACHYIYHKQQRIDSMTRKLATFSKTNVAPEEVRQHDVLTKLRHSSSVGQ